MTLMQQSWDGFLPMNCRKVFLLLGVTMNLVCTPCQACMRALQVTAWAWAWGAAWAWAWAEVGEDIEEWEALLQICHRCYWTLELYFWECLWEINFPPYFTIGIVLGLGQPILLLYWQIVPAVTELIAAQFLWLDYDDRTKPIYLYINSTGTMVSSFLNIENRKPCHLSSVSDIYWHYFYDYTFCSVTGWK